MQAHLPCGAVGAKKLDDIGAALLHDADVRHDQYKCDHGDHDQRDENTRHSYLPPEKWYTIVLRLFRDLHDQLDALDLPDDHMLSRFDGIAGGAPGCPDDAVDADGPR